MSMIGINGTKYSRVDQVKSCGRQPLKNLKGYDLLKQTISLKFFKGCLPQILLGPLLNTFSQIILRKITHLGFKT